MSEDILTVLIGSRAHGLERPESDWDYRGVFVTPLREICQSTLVGSGKLKESKHGDMSVDHLSYEVGHLLRYATKGNPSMIEVFGGPVIDSTGLGRELLSLFPYVWSSMGVYNSYRGYVKNQLRKYVDDMTGHRASKYALAALRNVNVAITLIQTGTVILDCSGVNPAEFDLMRRVRDGEMDVGEVMATIDTKLELLDNAYESSAKHLTNLDKLADWLYTLRREA